ncbi:ATP-binding cassette domain-containing protein [Mongoliimonas terrestris]|uniref:ATP-binding cassette domain-containing protein n=1 Tax=Mongoliimonas terrestris TaxID=1709001 RepID=UPI000949AC83|nr:ATP-binding cassette domain-containing protein [Mongoliimonas terrestris]
MQLTTPPQSAPVSSPRAAPALSDAPALVALSGIGKTYGSTRANADVSVAIRPGEVIGLVGANGAGKSTLMRILCGATEPDTGTLAIEGRPVDFSAYTPRAAHAAGIRIVWQELSLCQNLSVAENFFIEQPGLTRTRPGWRTIYRRLAAEGLAAVFPDAGIDPGRQVAGLSLGQRQMVEIVRAASDPALKLLILDEPTSSLDAERSRQLQAYVRRRAADGLAVVFISHKLGEIVDVADRILVMRNGRLVRDDRAADASVARLVEAMGDPGAAAAARRTRAPALAGATVRVRIDGDVTAPLGRPVDLRAGEIVGLAGLEGSGQRPLLHAIFEPDKNGPVKRFGDASFVSGDRRREGVFALWSVLDNAAIGRVAHWPALKPVSRPELKARVRPWTDRLGLDAGRLDNGILDLSGGNQQKALLARALVDDADIVLLDDPTRGVDIGAKRDFYVVAAETAAAARLVVWHSTEDAEFLECDRVLVFAHGRIVRELVGAEITEEALIAASFTPAEAVAGDARNRPGPRPIAFLFQTVPFVALAGIFAVMASINPLVASSFGIDLLLTPAVALVLIALAQMFVVGGSEIDLGAGAFAGLVNVVSATLLVVSPAIGWAGLAGGLVGYALMGWLIQARAIPAIVVTLGASFIWAGLGLTLQPSPGGAAPPWLAAVASVSVPGVPTPLVLILLAGAVAVAIDRAPLGTVLRAFGSNPEALARGGWQPRRYAMVRYLIAGGFATAAGLFLTATNGSSDINAGSSFTLLSIAAIVIGGCQLIGGVIAPAGVVAGAVALSLIGAFLASLGISTDFNAAVQGGLLILILTLRGLAAGRSGHAG